MNMKNIIEGLSTNDVRVYTHSVDKALKQAKDSIKETAQRYKNNHLSSKMGFVAEELHIGSFNVDSAIQRSTLKAVKEKNGFHGDYKVVDKTKVVSKGEFKHYATAKTTENAMRGYNDRVLIGAKEQIKNVKEIARRKALKNRVTRPDVTKEHQEVAKRATDRIEHNGVSSKPLNMKELKKATKKANKGVISAKDLLQDFRKDVKNSAKGGAMEGAKSGAIFGGGISLVSNVVDVYHGHKTKGEAMKDTIIDTTKSTAHSAVRNAVGSATKTASMHVAKRVSNETAKRVLGSSAPVIVAMGVVETLGDAKRYISGDIDGGTLAKSTGKNVATSAGAWAGAEVGASVGAIGGPIGVVVGGVVGGVLGSLGMSSLFD